MQQKMMTHLSYNITGTVIILLNQIVVEHCSMPNEVFLSVLTCKNKQ